MLKTKGKFELPHLFHVKIVLHRRSWAFSKVETLSLGCSEEACQCSQEQQHGRHLGSGPLQERPGEKEGSCMCLGLLRTHGDGESLRAWSASRHSPQH